MKITKAFIIITAVILTTCLISFWFYPRMPDRMATHFNASGQADGYASKEIGLFLMPVIMIFITAVFLFIPQIDPLKANYQKFRVYYEGFIIVFLVFMSFLHYFMILWNLGIHLSLNRLLPVAIALLFFYCGLLCRHAKRNWFVGIRTPWTLSSDIVWDRTHRIGGTLFMLSAFIVAAGAFFPGCTLVFIIAPVVTISIVVLIYSYVLYQKVK